MKILETVKLAEKVTTNLPSFFIGMDLVGQEDLGRPLIEFAKELLEAKNRTKLDYFFHAGETNWQGNYSKHSFINTHKVFLLVGRFCSILEPIMLF